MRIAEKNGTAILISIGMLLIALSQLVSHFLQVPDFFNGLIFGIGILFLAIIRR